MQQITRHNKTLEFYDSIKEMPSRVLIQFQIHLVQHYGMGSTFDQLDARFANLDTFLSNNMVQEAIDERKNQRMGFYYMFEGLDTTCLPAACLIKSIDGVPCIIRTDEQIEKMARLLMEEDLTIGELEEIIETVKKKVDEELKAYVPDIFNDDEEISVAMNTVQLALLRIRQVRDSEPVEDEIRQLNDLLLGMMRPKNFEDGNPENYQIQAEKSYAKLCAILRKENVLQPEEMPALDFYMNIDILKQKPVQHETDAT